MKKPTLVIILVFALLVSLAGNLYFGGHLLGRVVAAGPCDQPSWRQREQALKERLSPADFDVVMAHKKEKKKLFRQDRNALDDARRAVEKAMQAEPFDQAGLDYALAEEGRLKANVLNRMRKSREVLKEALSVEGRQTFDAVMAEHGLPDVVPPPPPPEEVDGK